MGMNEELPPVTKLTRYAIRFDLPASQVGTILGLFVGQVEAPKVEPLAADGSTFRMSALATLKQIHEVFGLIVEHGANVVLSPFVEKVSESVRPFQSRPQNVELPPGATITRLPVGKRKRTRVAGGARANQTATGQAVLRAFVDKSICRYDDFHDALRAAGLAVSGAPSTVTALVKAGFILRVSQGAYRRTTEEEQAAVEAQNNSAAQSG